MDGRSSRFVRVKVSGIGAVWPGYRLGEPHYREGMEARRDYAISLTLLATLRHLPRRLNPVLPLKIAPPDAGVPETVLSLPASNTTLLALLLNLPPNVVRFEAPHNQAWMQHARVVVKAFLHATCVLEVAVKYGRALTAPPRSPGASGRWRAARPRRPIGSDSCAAPRKPMSRPIWESGCGHRRHSLSADRRSQAGYDSAPSGAGADGTIF